MLLSNWKMNIKSPGGFRMLHMIRYWAWYQCLVIWRVFCARRPSPSRRRRRFRRALRFWTPADLWRTTPQVNTPLTPELTHTEQYSDNNHVCVSGLVLNLADVSSRLSLVRLSVHNFTQMLPEALRNLPNGALTFALFFLFYRLPTGPWKFVNLKKNE